MSISDFFKKDVVAFPSGRRAAEEGAEQSRYGRILSSMGKVAVGIALAATVVACGPSREEINAMKAQVPLRDSLALVSAYDSTLLAKIDSLHHAGKDMKTAVEKGVSLTWEQTRHSFPRTPWTGKEYILEDHADKRLDESRDRHESTVMMPMVISTGKSTMTMMHPQTVVSYTYKEEFRDRLAAEVQQQKDARTVQSVQTAKTVRNAGR